MGNRAERMLCPLDLFRQRSCVVSQYVYTAETRRLL